MNMNNADILSPTLTYSGGTLGVVAQSFASSPTMNNITATGSISFNGASDAHSFTVVDDDETKNSSGTTDRADPSTLSTVNVGNRADESVIMTCGSVDKFIVY
jgi:hypothetical protein